MIDKLIDKLYNIYDKDIVDNISVNKDNIKIIYDYFEKINIRGIDYIFEKRPHIFLLDINIIRNYIDKIGINKFIDSIDNDISILDNI